jgi:CubicO group peptidase (beta-lactamase class C family)
MSKKKFDASLIHGMVEPGFEEVRREFERNFSGRGELGAAFTVFLHGKKVVDLWGGYRDFRKRLPWEEDTLIPLFSTTKGISAITLALAHSRGLIDYDQKVMKYWPEFGQNGKEQITVRQLLAQQAGICAIDEPIDLNIMSDPDRLALILAKQKPIWDPGTKHGYHNWCLGWYESELIRRVDPRRRNLNQFFQDEIAAPLGLEIYIGLPDEVPAERVAKVEGISNPLQILFHLNEMPLYFVKEFANPKSILYRTMANPKLFMSHSVFNQREIQKLHAPSATGVGKVSSMAKLYGILATGGKELGISQNTMNELIKPAMVPQVSSYDWVFLTDMRYSLGFVRPFDAFPFGSNDKTFGFFGVGGSLGFADPDAGIGYAYVMTKLALYAWGSPREKALRDALYKCL